ncbi:acyl carrier protein [Uliginosibacterium sp. H1]|uniref:acyl carrier protein n=1 Tax=Uliginosibacterium sp. H1 TaxID=3114757 RepID=UPI002E19F8F9|nr:acyl carrier protein [Uliginosibacterium sp. H1]
MNNAENNSDLCDVVEKDQKTAADDHPATGLRATTVIESLRAIWQELLHVSNIDGRDDFFDLGGDSLGAIRMLERIGREFGEDLLEPDIIYTASRFDDLAVAISDALDQREPLKT